MAWQKRLEVVCVKKPWPLASAEILNRKKRAQQRTFSETVASDTHVHILNLPASLVTLAKISNSTLCNWIVLPCSQSVMQPSTFVEDELCFFTLNKVSTVGGYSIRGFIKVVTNFTTSVPRYPVPDDKLVMYMGEQLWLNNYPMCLTIIRRNRPWLNTLLLIAIFTYSVCCLPKSFWVSLVTTTPVLFTTICSPWTSVTLNTIMRNDVTIFLEAKMDERIKKE